MLCKQGVGGSSPPSSTRRNSLTKITCEAIVRRAQPFERARPAHAGPHHSGRDDQGSSYGMQTGAGRCHRHRLPIVQFAATASMALPAGCVACDRLRRPLTRRPLPRSSAPARAMDRTRPLFSVLKSGSARRGVAPTPLARRPCEETSPIAFAAPAALSALVAIRHLDLAPVVRSNQATPVFSHDRASPRCCGAVQEGGVKPGMQNMCRPYGIAGPWLAPARSAACHSAPGVRVP
jgi:hypothetical protein